MCWLGTDRHGGIDITRSRLLYFRHSVFVSVEGGGVVEVDRDESVKRLKAAMLSQGLSVDQVAHLAGKSPRTVRSVLSGKNVHANSLHQVMKALKTVVALTLDEEQLTAPAKKEYGAYTFEAVEDYVGDYFLFRNSYDYKDRVVCSDFSIFWDRQSGILKFCDRQNNISDDGKQHPYYHTGYVAIPHGIGIMYFMFRENSIHRLMTTTMIRNDDEAPYFRGIISTINWDGDNERFFPVASPICGIMRRDDLSARELDARIGSHSRDGFWNPMAVRVLRSFGRSSAFHL